MAWSIRSKLVRLEKGGLLIQLAAHGHPGAQTWCNFGVTNIVLFPVGVLTAMRMMTLSG
jgi:hypothetical protein